jgi:hypothetical protein
MPGDIPTPRDLLMPGDMPLPGDMLGDMPMPGNMPGDMLGDMLGDMPGVMLSVMPMGVTSQQMSMGQMTGSSPFDWRTSNQLFGMLGAGNYRQGSATANKK